MLSFYTWGNATQGAGDLDQSTPLHFPLQDRKNYYPFLPLFDCLDRKLFSAGTFSHCVCKHLASKQRGPLNRTVLLIEEIRHISHQFIQEESLSFVPYSNSLYEGYGHLAPLQYGESHILNGQSHATHAVFKMELLRDGQNIMHLAAETNALLAGSLSLSVNNCQLMFNGR